MLCCFGEDDVQSRFCVLVHYHSAIHGLFPFKHLLGCLFSYVKSLNEISKITLKTINIFLFNKIVLQDVND